MLRVALLGLLLFLAGSFAVDRSKFKRCDQTFCRRARRTPEKTFGLTTAPALSDGVLTGDVSGSGVPLELRVFAYTSGAVRVRLTEKDMEPRWEPADVVLDSQLTAVTPTVVSAADSGIEGATDAGYMFLAFTSSDDQKQVVRVQYTPLVVTTFVDGKAQTSVNSRSLSHFEHRRTRTGEPHHAATTDSTPKDPHHGRKILDWGEDGKPIYEDGGSPELDVDEPATGGDVDGADAGARSLQSANDPDDLWEERFGSHTDSKPNGPMSVGVDITFHGATQVYGIPEHATSLALKSTDGSSGAYSEPYRLYNLDVFEYELDEPMALYGSIPFMLSLGADAPANAVFWNNPTETFVDVAKSGSGVDTRWVSETGNWDLFLFPGPAPKDAMRQYTQVTGTQALPPMFALGYHQCRWNYKDENDVFSVDAKFEEHNFPYDVLWLDIEHTNGKRYFTWDAHLFPNPAAMQEKLAARGRRMVTIIDPHIKRDPGYPIHSEATDKGYYLKTPSGSDFDGWCWPGSSSYLDFTSPEVREWWASRFAFDKYIGSTKHLFTWNDMNEMSAFNGPEVTIQKDIKSLAGVEHREWHNLYGFYQQWATGDGQVARNDDANARPFVLSRAFFAGSQRFGAIWTGDNKASWDHLQVAAPMLLSIGVSGLTFAGADVGGFFKNPDKELLTRWYQAGSFQPFFRAHAHIETQRREPWLFGDETLGHLRAAVRNRYTFLPLWYTLFYEASVSGAPTMRPLWAEYPTDATTLTMDDQWLVGSDLLVKPVTHQGATSVSVYFPGSEPWYDVVSYDTVTGPTTSVVTAPIDKIPVFQRGGSIVPRRLRPRRCADLMAADPFTLVVALDSAGSAAGSLYIDDGVSFNHQRKGEFTYTKFAFSGNTLTGTPDMAGYDAGGAVVERVVVAGLSSAPSTITINDGASARTATFKYDAATKVLTIRKPDVSVASAFSIVLA